MNMQRVGSKIRELRKQKGLSQNELADGICSVAYISIIERGVFTGDVSIEILSAISMRLGVRLQDLFDDVEIDDIEIDVLLDIVKVSILRGEYTYALDNIDQLQKREDLLHYQQQQLTLTFADCLIKKGDVSKAIDILSDLSKSLEVKQTTDQYFLAKLSNLFGNAFYNSHDLITAHAHYTRAHQISSSFPTEDLLSANISYNLGITCQSLRLDLQAQLHLEHAMKLYENLGERRRLAGSLYWLGITLKNLDQIERAGEYIKQSLALYEAENITKMVQITRSVYAFHFIAPHDHELGISELRKSLEEYEKIGDFSLMTFNFARIADLYIEVGEISKAQEAIENAKLILSEVEDIIVIAFFHRIYARVLAEVKQFDESIENSYKSAELCDKMGLAKEKANSLHQAVKVLQIQGKVEDALTLSMEVSEILYRSFDFLVLT